MTSKWILGLVAAALLPAALPSAAMADIIPNDPGPRKDDPEAREVVRKHLDRLGVSPLEARRIVEQLRADEARFFASSEKANAVVAGLWLEEWIGAAIYLAIVAPKAIETWKRYILLRDD